MMKKFQIVILAGGEGKRMAAGREPKVLLPLGGKPLLAHVALAVIGSGLDPRPTVVVGKNGEQIVDALGPSFQYIYQAGARGTGGAMLAAKRLLQTESQHVLVLPGDHPFVSIEFLQNLATAHLKGGTVMTLASARVQDYEHPSAFVGFDRLARNSLGQVIKLLPPFAVRASEPVWSEVSPGYFAFQASWLWPNLYRLSEVNLEREARLGDLVNVAVGERKWVNEIPTVPTEALGADTPEQFKYLETKLLS